MSIILNPSCGRSDPLLSAIHCHSEYRSCDPVLLDDWYFTFVGRNYPLGLKTYLFSSLKTDKQIIKNATNMLSKSTIHYIIMEFDKKNWDTLLDRSSKQELFLECLIKNTDTLIPICRLPVICPDTKTYYVAKTDISPKFEGTFNRIHFKTTITAKGKCVIRFAIERS
jgi:hypothetical protein